VTATAEARAGGEPRLRVDYNRSMPSESLRGASLGAIIAYVVATIVPWVPTLHFFPRLGVWSMGLIAGEPAISWYGTMIDTALGGLIGAALAQLTRRAPSWRWISGIAAVSLLALTWHERHWFVR
jgi:hypothetical protein